MRIRTEEVVRLATSPGRPRVRGTPSTGSNGPAARLRTRESDPEPSSSNTDTTIATPAPEPTSRRAGRTQKGWRRGPIIVAGAVAAIGAVGTGFVVQGAVTAQNDRIAETRAITEAANTDVQQLDAHGGILEARAVKQAEDALGGANDTINAAQGKADASALAASVAALDDYKLRPPSASSPSSTRRRCTRRRCAAPSPRRTA